MSESGGIHLEEPVPPVPHVSGLGGAMRVKITDIEMPFGSMVVFMVKWAIASIPAIMILWFLMFAVMLVLAAIFGTLGAVGSSAMHM